MTTRNAFLMLAAVALIGCQAAEEPAAAPESRSVESEAAGVLVLALPTGFSVASNDADGLRLAVAPEAGGGEMTVTMSPVFQGGLNIIEAVETEMANFESMPEGRSFGQTKMVAPIGLTYMARGRYQLDSVETEELRAMLAHPWGNRLLTLSYVYPAGEDTSDRGAQLMEVLGEMEPLEEPTAD